MRLIPAPDVRFAGTDDGAMLLDLSTGRFYGLNPTAAIMWRHIAAGTAPEIIAEQLSGELGVAGERLLSDVRSLVAVLHRHGVLVGEEATP
ncbi:PqqD family peptide modification chaperone [Nocardiopsis synnemataformans]|uniref:PqqD family peptide modification chaperone n=1 Tax=Nocardiopsis synnemataformans TaxID=61305 RepID=UPI003EBBB7F8